MVGRAEKGLFITTGSFTASARAEATRDGAPPIDLVDGDDLADKLKELKLGVATRMVESVDSRRRLVLQALTAKPQRFDCATNCPAS
jgi:restriction endonuclease Mrr